MVFPGQGSQLLQEAVPGKVLAGLCRRINKDVSTTFIDSIDSLQKSLDA